LQLSSDELVRACRECASGAAVDENHLRRLVEIPVRYGGADGPDLGYIAETAGLSEADVVALHTAGPMPVLMIGFMPGFPYIGGLPPRLRVPRRAEPRTAVPVGSVALANDQTGIYPSRAPGGWHLIGRTEAALFDPLCVPPALLAPGDLVRFVALSQP
jgi:inhibitor of KinA